MRALGLEPRTKGLKVSYGGFRFYGFPVICRTKHNAKNRYKRQNGGNGCTGVYRNCESFFLNYSRKLPNENGRDGQNNAVPWFSSENINVGRINGWKNCLSAFAVPRCPAAIREIR